MILQKQNKAFHEFFQYFDYIPVPFHITLFVESLPFQIPVSAF